MAGEIELLPYIHGAYNFAVFLFFLYQASTGLKIRKDRLLEKPPAFPRIKRHRKLGPLLVAAGIFGFLIGLTIVYLEDGRVLVHPLHFASGFLISLLLILTYIVSRQIRGREPKWRTLHFAIGIALICFYSLQIVLGLNMLFFH